MPHHDSKTSNNVSPEKYISSGLQLERYAKTNRSKASDSLNTRSVLLMLFLAILFIFFDKNLMTRRYMTNVIKDKKYSTIIKKTVFMC